MELMDCRMVNERFTKIRKLAQTGGELPERHRTSEADVEAYETCCGIFRDLQDRMIGKAELQARGNLARAKYVAKKRAELLQDVIYANAQAAYKRSSQLSAALCKPWTGTPMEMIDAVCDLIAALEGTDAAAKIICGRMKDVLLGEGRQSGETSQNLAATLQKGTAGKASAKFVPPTLQEVKAYFKEKHFSSSPEAFHAHYEGSGWVRSKGVKIKDWKATARSWELKEAQFAPARGRKKESVYSSDASYDLEAYRKTAIGLRPPQSAAVPQPAPPKVEPCEEKQFLSDVEETAE